MVLHKSTGRVYLGFALALLTTFLWGILPILLKRLLDSMDPYTLIWYRFLLASVIQLVVVVRKDALPAKDDLKGMVPFMIILAVCSLCGNYILYTSGLNHLSPSTATVLIQLAPIFLLLGGVIVFREQFSIRQWFGFILLLCGLTLFFNNRIGELVSSFSELSFGVILIVGAAVTWAIYALAQKQLLTVLSSESLLLVIFVSGVVFFFPFSSLSLIQGLTAIDLLLLVFCAVSTMIAYTSFTKALTHWEASRVSAVLSTAPLITMMGMALCALFLPGFVKPETLNILNVSGAFLVVCGSFLCTLTVQKKA